MLPLRKTHVRVSTSTLEVSFQTRRLRGVSRFWASVWQYLTSEWYIVVNQVYVMRLLSI
jgi:hypothetical protein